MARKIFRKDVFVLIHKITKRQKIRYLIADNKKLLEENQKLKGNENTNLVTIMTDSINDYREINKKIYSRYKQLDKLWFEFRKNKFLLNHKLFMLRIKRLILR